MTPRSPRPARRRGESRLLAEIRLAVGARMDFMVTRINTGVFSAPNAPATRIRSAPTGFPDLIGTQLRRVLEHHRIENNFSLYEEDRWHYYGQAIAIETKAVKGRLSDEQIGFRRQFEDVGGLYITAYSLQDVLDELGECPAWAHQRPLERKP